MQPLLKVQQSVKLSKLLSRQVDRQELLWQLMQCSASAGGAERRGLAGICALSEANDGEAFLASCLIVCCYELHSLIGYDQSRENPWEILGPFRGL